MSLLENLFVCFLGIILGIPAQEISIHVSPHGDDHAVGSAAQPLATLTAAQQLVREKVAAGHDGPIEVVVASGVWNLAEPLVFDHRDASLKTPVTYCAQPGQMVQLSGGVQITVWQKKGDFWVTTPTPQALIETAIRQLVVDGSLAARAFEPDGEWYRVAETGPDRRTAFRYDPQGFVEPKQAEGVELVFLHDWSITRVGLQQIDPIICQLTFDHAIGGDHDFFAIDGFEPRARYRLENDRAFADKPGEWYVDTMTGEIALRSSPDQAAPPQVILPRLATLIRIVGTAEQPVRGLTLEGFEFRDTRCTLPAAGGAEVQAGFFQPRGESSDSEGWLNRLAPAVELSFAEEVVIRNCKFRNVGGGGVHIHQQSHGNRIERCEFRDLGGCAVMIGDPSPARSASGEQMVCRDNQLSGCTISEVGQILYGSVGVWVGITAGTRIEGNEIFDLPYTGVSVGWQWNPEPTGCRDNAVVRNHIYRVMQLLSDGGGIYTLGRQPGTVLRDNRIHDIPLNAGRAESNGIFMDEGSSLIEVTGNEIFGIARAPIRFHKAQELMVQNNRLSVLAGIQPFTYNATDPAQIVTEPNDILEETAR